jgi:hypothetical protein
MAYSFRHTNPRLTGVIIKEKVRCGRKNCRCVRENKLHGWYYYLYWREGKILKKSYIPKTEIDQLKQKIKQAKWKDMKDKKILKEYMKLFRQLF